MGNQAAQAPYLQPADDEIDLSELAAALKRRWRWLAGLTIAGVCLGGLVSAWESKQTSQTFSALIDTSKGPSLRKNWTQDQSNMAKILKATQPASSSQNGSLDPVERPSATSTQFTIQNLIDQADSNPVDLKVTPAKVGKDPVPDVLLITSNATDSRLAAQSLTALLQAYQTKAKEDIQARANPTMPPIAPQSGWVQTLQPETQANHLGRSLALGLLGGLVLGSAAALGRDRQAGREYSLRRIQQRLGLPLWLDLPPSNALDSFPPEAPQPLLALMQPELHWLVVDVAKAHPQASALASNLGIARGPILLKEALKAPTSKDIGLLVVCEAGFNSPEALDRAGNYLRQLAPAQAALVLLNVPAPREMQ
jgi:hypothetical protein